MTGTTDTYQDDEDEQDWWRPPEPADVVAKVWFDLGYRPRDSLALVGVTPDGLGLGAVVRGDLPARAARHRIAAAVAAMAPALVATGSEDAFAVVFGVDALATPEPVRGVLRVALPRAGLHVVDVIGVSPTAHGSLLCRAPECCPPAGVALERVLESETAARAVLAGAVLHEDEADVIADVLALPRADLDTGVSSVPLPGAVTPARWWAYWRAGLRSGDFPATAGAPDSGPGPAGFALALLDPDLRDRVALSALGAPPRAWSRGGDRSGPADRLAPLDGLVAALPPVLETPPDPARLVAPRRLLARAAREAGPGRRAGALAVLGLQAWYLADGVRARLLTDLARADAGPAVPLTDLVRTALTRGVPPPWVRPGGRGPLRRADAPDG
jgi:hypothetical protein